MIHKNGFTLAETLLTLIVIGIVMIMTIPTFIADTKNREYISILKMHMYYKTQPLGLLRNRLMHRQTITYRLKKTQH